MLPVPLESTRWNHSRKTAALSIPFAHGVRLVYERGMKYEYKKKF